MFLNGKKTLKTQESIKKKEVLCYPEVTTNNILMCFLPVYFFFCDIYSVFHKTSKPDVRIFSLS